MPPSSATGSRSRTIAARVPRPSSPVPRPQIPAQLASRRASAAPPHRSPAIAASPIAAATGVRLPTQIAPASTGTPTPHIPIPHTPADDARPAHRPAPKPIAIHMSGGRTAASRPQASVMGFAPQRGASATRRKPSMRMTVNFADSWSVPIVRPVRISPARVDT